MVEAINRFWRCLPLLLAVLALPPRAQAHQLDEYLQATLVNIEPGKIRLQINLTPGVAVAEKVLGLIDQNHDGAISTNESTAYAELLKRELVARLDGREIQWKLTSSSFPEPAEMRTGWGIILLEFSATPGALASGPHRFTLENRHRPVASTYLFNAARPESTEIQISAQKRDENQSTGEIAFDYQPPPNSFKAASIVVALGAVGVIMFAGALRTRTKPDGRSLI